MLGLAFFPICFFFVCCVPSPFTTAFPFLLLTMSSEFRDSFQLTSSFPVFSILTVLTLFEHLHCSNNRSHAANLDGRDALAYGASSLFIISKNAFSTAYTCFAASLLPFDTSSAWAHASSLPNLPHRHYTLLSDSPLSTFLNPYHLECGARATCGTSTSLFLFHSEQRPPTSRALQAQQQKLH